MDQVTLIREKTDIISLISEFVPLKKTGRNFHGLCPFHNEKTPSFVVSPERQIWHCFGCSKGGDAYSFLMDFENIEFPEALQILAKRAGIELVREQFNSGNASQKEAIYTLNHLALEYYHYVLTKHNVGKKALDYLLTKRHLTLPLVETFMLGFSPVTGTALVSYLINKKKYKKEDIVNAGLGFFRGGRIVDFFRNRLMFPLIDHRGNIVGFSGRSLTDLPQDGPKYINTRETLVYQKGSHFFGINRAKEEMRKTKQAIIVEGEFDAISCFKEGIGNVVASKGTALTQSQIQLLSRFVEKVSLCLDQDNAGQDAMFRSLPILEKKGLVTTVIIIPFGKDPDEAVGKDVFAFKKALKEDIPIYDFAIKRAISLFDKKTAEGKRSISKTLLPIFGRIGNEIVKEHYLKKLSTELNTTYESIGKELDRALGKTSFEDQIKTAAVVKRKRPEILEEYLFSLLVQNPNPKEAIEKVSGILKELEFNFPVYKRILEGFVEFFKNYGKYDSTSFAASLPKETMASYNSCFLFPLPPFRDEKKQMMEIESVAKELKNLYVRDKIKALGEKIKNQKLESEDVEVLKKELSMLISSLKSDF